MKRFNLKLIIFVFLIVVIGVFGVKALLNKGYYTSHDGWHQVARLHYFDQAIKDNNIPPRYVRYLYYGYGYPLFIFSYQLPWIIAEPFMLVGFNVFDSIKAVYFIGFILSGLTMFIWLRQRFGNIAAFTGAVIYMWAPFRFSNIFVRGAIGDATVFVFLPLLFLAIDLSKNKFKWITIVLGAFSLACIILSHAIVAVLALSLTALYMFSSIIFSRDKIRYAGKILLFSLLGLLLTSYYLVPSFVTKKFTQFDEKIQATQYDGQFANLGELLYSKWGFGFSAPRAFDSMSFQLGIAQWLTVGLFVLYLSYSLVKRRKIKERDFLVGILGIFLLSIILILPSSASFWKFIGKILFTIDFPWRLLALTVFSSSALAAYVVSRFSLKVKMVLSLFLLVIAFYTNRNHIRVNQYTDVPLSLYLLSEDTTNTYDEYLPKKIDTQEIERLKKGGVIESLDKADIRGIENKVNSLAFNYNTGKKMEFTVNLLYFPGWDLFIDGVKKDLRSSNKGLMIFQGDGGEHKVLIKYTGTKVMKLSNYVSFFTLIILLLGLFFKQIIHV